MVLTFDETGRQDLTGYRSCPAVCPSWARPGACASWASQRAQRRSPCLSCEDPHQSLSICGGLGDHAPSHRLCFVRRRKSRRREWFAAAISLCMPCESTSCARLLWLQNRQLRPLGNLTNQQRDQLNTFLLYLQHSKRWLHNFKKQKKVQNGWQFCLC